VIEVISEERCTDCNLCVEVCPTNVFDRQESGPPTIARQDDCQTCYMCEAWCPVEAIFVAPFTWPAEEGSWYRDEAVLEEKGYLGKYRVDLGWARGMKPSASIATEYMRAQARLVGGDAIAKRTAEVESKISERDRLLASVREAGAPAPTQEVERP
jgi:NAD-dependent dihydropyrimidine dehydrogenase PreA subunit